MDGNRKTGATTTQGRTSGNGQGNKVDTQKIDSAIIWRQRLLQMR